METIMKKRSALAGLLLLMPLAVTGQERDREPERTVTVSATATVEREPEKAMLLLAVESTGATARAASEANATRMAAVIAALRKAGIPDREIRTISYELHPQYAPPPDRPRPLDASQEPRIVGYRASNMVQVGIDPVSRVGAIIDAAINAGANRVANLTYELRDPDAARRDALRLAIEKARSEAQVMAEAAGQRLGPPLNINTSSYTPPRFAGRVMMDVAQESMLAAPTPIEPGMLSVSATVNITFRLVQ